MEVPRAHLEALRRFDLDTVMFPVYPALWSRPEYREPAEALLAVCAERDVGVMVIKAPRTSNETVIWYILCSPLSKPYRTSPTSKTDRSRRAFGDS